MQCPDEQLLRVVLAEELDGVESGPDIWRHVESCRLCQQVLGQLADDQELRQWRDLPEFSQSRLRIADSDACRDLVNRCSANDTLRDDGTTSVDAHRIYPSFARSAVTGDLGILDRFRILREIGRGGMSLVFEAIDSQLGRHVAIKILSPNPLDRNSHQRFLREAQSIASIRHPHVVTIYGVEAASVAGPYIVMELISGPSLRDVIENQLLPVREAVEIVAQVADGLDAAHRSGLVHRDIKPGNILLAPDDLQGRSAASGEPPGTAAAGRRVPKLADFGLARPRDVSAQITRTGILAGTPAYVSPEQIANPDLFDARSDIYSLGVTLYESLTGTVPFRGALHAVLRQIEEGEPPAPCRLNPLLPRDLETICLKAMNRDANRRYSTARDFAADLRRWLNGEPIHARPVSPWERAVRWTRRNPKLGGLIGTVASLLVVLAGGATVVALYVRSANERLQDEKNAALAAGLDARQSADAALRQRQLALDSLDALVSKVQQQLGARPGTLKLREDILRTAFAGLERITASSDNGSADHTTISAHLRMGEILTALGQAKESIDQYRKAQELAERAMLASPDDVEFLRDLANALALEGDFYQRAFAWDKAGPIFNRVLEKRRRLAELLPNDPSVRHQVFACQQRLIDHKQYTGKTDEAIDDFQQLLADIQESLKRFPDDRQLQRDENIVHDRMGVLYEARGELNDAQDQFNVSLQLAEQRLAHDPDDPGLQQGLALAVGRIAALASRRRDFDLAVPMAEHALQSFRRLADADPEDTGAQIRLATWWHSTFLIRLAQEEFEIALDALRNALAIYQRLTEQHPSTSRFPSLAAEVCVKLSDLELRMGRVHQARQWIEQCRDFLQRCPGTADYSEATNAPQLLLVELFIPALELVMKGREAIDAAMPGHRNEASFAQAVTMYLCAIRGEADATLACGEPLRGLANITPPQTFDLVQFLCARACAVGVTRLRMSNDSAGSDTLPRLIEQCAEFTRALVTRSPAAKAWFWQEHEFDAIRNEPAFEQALSSSNP